MSFKKPNLKLSGAKWKTLITPCIYAWKRESEFLYIGASSTGVARALFQHHVIGKREPVRSGDEFLFIFGEPPEIFIKESQLIEKFKPKYNVAATLRRVPENLRVCRNVLCSACGEQFMQKRWWQSFCSKRCQQGNGIRVTMDVI